MKLLYCGKDGKFINGIPARDLESHEVQKIANEWNMSLAETEGLLIQRGLYKAEKIESTAEVATAIPIKKKSSRKEGE